MVFSVENIYNKLVVMLHIISPYCPTVPFYIIPIYTVSSCLTTYLQSIDSQQLVDLPIAWNWWIRKLKTTRSVPSQCNTITLPSILPAPQHQLTQFAYSLSPIHRWCAVPIFTNYVYTWQIVNNSNIISGQNINMI